MRRLVTLMTLLGMSIARAEPGVLVVTVTGIQSSDGHVLVAVCDQGTFLQPTCRYHGRIKAKIGAITMRIEGIPSGVYAAQAFADANDNGQIDRSLLGIPTEGIGFSNNAKMLFGPPSFADAAFSIGPMGGQVTLGLRYY